MPVIARVLRWQDALRYVCLCPSLAGGVRRYFLGISSFYDHMEEHVHICKLLMGLRREGGFSDVLG